MITLETCWVCGFPVDHFNSKKLWMPPFRSVELYDLEGDVVYKKRGDNGIHRFCFHHYYYMIQMVNPGELN